MPDNNHTAHSETDSQSPTPYDDVARTLLNDCSTLILPVLNETFGEHYRGDEKITFAKNEHYINQQDGKADKRVTDSSFTVIGEKEPKKYLYEVQSTADSSMLVRIFEYATQVALDEGELVGNILEVTIPNCAVLFLRSTKNTPDKMTIKISASGGSLSIDVFVMKSQKYELDEIFQKGLLFLLPFYIFSHEKYLEEYDKDQEKLAHLEEEYVRIMNELDELQLQGKISAYTRKTIVEMSHKVLENLAKKYENVKKGVNSVMGGKVLEYETKTIFREGMKEGLREGKQEGLREGKFETLLQNLKKLMQKMGISAEKAMDLLDVSEEERAELAKRI
ncbi:MAG: hypothetical protein LUI87_18945 [Lachnospiraceae bacterium]|nr:hypothetical protein [Lachnospiraceae bacterium]